MTTPTYCVHCGKQGRDTDDDHRHPIAYECGTCRTQAVDEWHDPYDGTVVTIEEGL